MSKYNKTDCNLNHKLKNNINIFEDTVHQFKKIEAPSFFSSEHLNLINTFEQLITAYSIQLNSINDDGEVNNWKLFLVGEKIEDKETEKIGLILISMLTKCSTLTFTKNLKNKLQ